MIKLVVQMIFLIKALNHYKLYSYCTKRLSIKLLSRVLSLLVRDSRVHRAHLISGAYQRIRANQGSSDAIEKSITCMKTYLLQCGNEELFFWKGSI